jgi:prevent-host-death family protein
VNLTSKESVEAFKQRPERMLERVEQTRRAILLTRNGRPRAVLQDAGSYRDLLATKDRLETILGVRAGLRDYRAGRFKSAETVFRRLKKKHGL